MYSREFIEFYFIFNLRLVNFRFSFKTVVRKDLQGSFLT